MKSKSLLALAVVVLAGFCAGRARGADVAGAVTDAGGHPVAAVKIMVKGAPNQVLGAATTGADGKYRVIGIAPGVHDYVLDPLGTGFKGGDLVAALGAKGLTINWKLARTGPAMATASEGAEVEIAGDPFGYSAAEFASMLVLGAGVVAGGVVGGYGAAGGFSGGNGSPASPSL